MHKMPSECAGHKSVKTSSLRDVVRSDAGGCPSFKMALLALLGGPRSTRF